MSEQEVMATAPRRRGRPPGSKNRTTGGTATRAGSRSRGTRSKGPELVETLNTMVNDLIKENRSLKRQLEKASQGGGTAAASIEKGLRNLQRRVERAFTASPTTRRRRTTGAAAATRRRRSKRSPTEG
ncbi:MAG: hypothetical protein M3072_12710 [Candidatus Dormibacteraeota bacterium]|nr:hypothetical protein [Candidatus Dormibacteraeota bacterium]